MPIQLDIVTPEKKVFSDIVEDIYLPTQLGETGVLAGHTALVTPLEPGELRYKQNGEYIEFAVGEGFMEATQESVTVLTDLCTGHEDIDENAVEEAMKRAEDALAGVDPNSDPSEVIALQAVIAKSLAQLKLKRKYK